MASTTFWGFLSIENKYVEGEGGGAVYDLFSTVFYDPRETFSIIH